MQNWDDELRNIMARKMNELTTRSNNNNGSGGDQSKVVISAPITLTDANFGQAINKYPLLVVDFWAPWCGPCRLVSPTIEQLASELAGKVVFGKLNVDENRRIASGFGIQSIPTIAIFKSGKNIDGFIGVTSKSQMQARILSHVNDSSSDGQEDSRRSRMYG